MKTRMSPEQLLQMTRALDAADLDVLEREIEKEWQKEPGNWTHCKFGHEFTAFNTMRKANGKRRCRICANREKRMADKRTREAG